MKSTEGNFGLLSKYFICRESDISKERIQKILATGANVILTTGGIDDMCLKYFVEAGAMAVRRVLKKDLKRIAKAAGGMSPASSQVWRPMFLYVTVSLHGGASIKQL